MVRLVVSMMEHDGTWLLLGLIWLVKTPSVPNLVFMMTMMVAAAIL